ncbi:MAG: hypothetical protein K2W96_13105 [Gemmataceae bacterium]|nr:hypothetical protein [Gemmataceae bacterium]
MLALLGLLAASAGAGEREAGPDPPSLAEVEKRMLDARRKIRRGVLRFSCTTKEKGEAARMVEYAAWFDLDADKCRIDRIQAGAGGSSRRQIQCRNCETAGYGVDYHDLRTEKGASVLTLAPLGQLTDLSLFDARLLGFVAAVPSQYRHCHLESLLASPDRVKPEVRRDSHDGAPCLVVSFTMRNGNRVEVWGDPAQGDSVVRIVLENTRKEGPFRVIVENKVKLDESSGVWFPDISTYAYTQNGEVMETVTAKVVSARLNVPTDDTVFTLAGMDLRKGLVIRRLHEDGKDSPFTWTGESMEKWKRPEYTIPPMSAAPSRAWLYWTAGGLGAAAVLALVLYFRRRPA